MAEVSIPTDTTDVRPAYLIGALSAGAGVIHLMMAPVHAASSQLEAIGFAAAGWFQIVVAMLLVFRPSRRLLAVAGLGNAVILTAWVWSRTKGLPVGSNPWQPEAVGRVDLTSALFEAGVVIGAIVQLTPHPKHRLSAVASIIGALAVVGVTTAVLVSPETADHHGGAGSAGSSADPVAATANARCDEAFNPVSYWREATLSGALAVPSAGTDNASGMPGGHPHGAASSAAASPPPTLGPLRGKGSAELDRLFKMANEPGEAAAGFVVGELANASDAEYEEFVRALNPANNTGHGASASGNSTTGSSAAGEGPAMSHLGPQPWQPMTDTAACAQVRSELDQARAVANRYPTAESAMAAGYVRIAPYVPGIASHWMKFSTVDGKFNIDEPEMLLYDGNGKDAKITGLSYYLLYDSDSPPTQGFTGDNDAYHRHLGLCTSPAGVIGDSTTTDEQCAAMGGKKSNGGSGWMSHAWVVPGCESPWGVFSGINPLLDGNLGKESGKNGGNCAASNVKKRYNLAPASKATMPTTTVAATGEQAAGE